LPQPEDFDPISHSVFGITLPMVCPIVFINPAIAAGLKILGLPRQLESFPSGEERDDAIEEPGEQESPASRLQLIQRVLPTLEIIPVSPSLRRNC